MKARGWQLLLFLVLAVALTVSARTTGSLLSFGMLVLPPLAALRLHRGMTSTLALSCGLGFVGTLAGLALAVSADLHVESSIVLSLFLLIPVCAGWRRHPGLGLAIAALAVAGGSALEPVRDDPHHEHHERAAHPDPFHVDVRLEASQPRVGGAIRVSWTAEVHHEREHEAEPASVWLLLTGDGLFEQHVLLPTLHALRTEGIDFRGTLFVGLMLTEAGPRVLEHMVDTVLYFEGAGAFGLTCELMQDNSSPRRD